MVVRTVADELLTICFACTAMSVPASLTGCTEGHRGRSAESNETKIYLFTVGITTSKSVDIKTFKVMFFVKIISLNFLPCIDLHMVNRKVVDDMLALCFARMKMNESVFNTAFIE